MTGKRKCYMIKSTITATYQTDIEAVWNIVTDNSNYSWRSDLSKIEIIDEKKFIEYAKNSFETHFTITAKEPFKLYEFQLENRNLEGKWIGKFFSLPNGETKIEFTEELSIKDPLVEIITKIFKIIKKMQKTYVEDLRKALKDN